jgi:hypothetical protein
LEAIKGSVHDTQSLPSLNAMSDTMSMCNSVYPRDYNKLLPSRTFDEYDLAAYTDDERLTMRFDIKTQLMLYDTLGVEMQGRMIAKQWMQDAWFGIDPY